MAWRQSPGGSQQHLTRAAAAARTRTQRPGKHLAVHAPELVVKPDFQILRRYRRPLLLRLEHTHRPTLEGYVHRATRLGRSRSLNLRIGITGKNAPCPMCGGRDRFKFFDTDGNGTWFCRQCSPEGGAGADLVMRFHGLAFRDAAKLIEEHVGSLVAYAKPKPSPDPRPRLCKLWADAKPTVQGDIVDTYLRSRGVGLDVYPDTIRTAQSLRYYDDDAAGTFPAMLAVVHDLTGKPVTIHRTYIAPDGSGKAPVEKPRKIACRHGRSPHVRLAPVMSTMGIAEGIESALSAMKLFRTPTWSVLSTYGIETFEPPVEIERLIVFADNDANGAGQKAAYALAVRLSGRIVVEVKFPKEPGTDWNDALRRG